MSDETAENLTGLAYAVGRAQQQAEQRNRETAKEYEQQRQAHEAKAVAAYLGAPWEPANVNGQPGATPFARAVAAVNRPTPAKSNAPARKPMERAKMGAAIQRAFSAPEPPDPIAESLERIAEGMGRSASKPSATKGFYPHLARSTGGMKCQTPSCTNDAYWNPERGVYACRVHMGPTLDRMVDRHDAGLTRSVLTSRTCSRCGTRNAPFEYEGVIYCEGCAPWSKRRK